MEENSGMWLRLAGRVYREDISMVYEAVEGLVQYGLDKGLYLRWTRFMPGTKSWM